MAQRDATHDPARRSWVASANAPGADFPIQNLPLGLFTPPGGGAPRAGVAIGDAILELEESLPDGTLNAVLAQGAPWRRALRARLSEELAEGIHNAR